MSDVYKHFQPLISRKGYSESNALSLAVACYLAYANKTAIKEHTGAWGFSESEVFTVKKGRDIDTQCFITADDKNVLIVFRGSDSKQDWFANFQASQDPGPLKNSYAHEGFQDALFPAVIAVTKTLEQMDAHNKRIWVCGHSLGGALCSLYSGMLIENGFTIYGLYTFASPRPGSESYAKQLNEKVTGPHFRIVNNLDIVPHVPPEPFFSHPGKRVILKSNRKDRSKKSWLAERVAALKHFISITGEVFDVKDNHTLVGDDESYIPRLLKDWERSKR